MYSNTCKNMIIRKYSYKYTYNYTSICICIHVSIPRIPLMTSKMKSISTIITMSSNIIMI